MAKKKGALLPKTVGPITLPLLITHRKARIVDPGMLTSTVRFEVEVNGQAFDLKADMLTGQIRYLDHGIRPCIVEWTSQGLVLRLVDLLNNGAFVEVQLDD